MAQTITDFKSFLEDAKEAVTELSDFTKKEEQLRMEELRAGKISGGGAESSSGCHQHDCEETSRRDGEQL